MSLGDLGWLIFLATLVFLGMLVVNDQFTP